MTHQKAASLPPFQWHFQPGFSIGGSGRRSAVVCVLDSFPGPANQSMLGITPRLARFQLSCAIYVTYILSSRDHVLTPQTAFVTNNIIGILNWTSAEVPRELSFVIQVVTCPGDASYWRT